jgi:hypothetical protein
MSSSHTTRFLAPPVGYWELPYIIIGAIYVYLINDVNININYIKYILIKKMYKLRWNYISLVCYNNDEKHDFTQNAFENCICNMMATQYVTTAI